MGRFLSGFGLVVFGGVVGYALAKLEDKDQVERAYRKVKRKADAVLDAICDEDPKQAAAVREAADQLADEFSQFKARVVGDAG